MTWTQQTSSASFSPRYGHGCAVLGAQMVLVGGYDTDYFSDVWISTNMGSTWTNKTSGSFSARVEFGIAVFLGKLWVISGFGSNNYIDVWYSDGTTLSNWTLANDTAFPYARYGMGVTVFSGRMWVAAGYRDGPGYSNDVWRRGR